MVRALSRVPLNSVSSKIFHLMFYVSTCLDRVFTRMNHHNPERETNAALYPLNNGSRLALVPHIPHMQRTNGGYVQRPQTLAHEKQNPSEDNSSALRSDRETDPNPIPCLLPDYLVKQRPSNPQN
ncbi:hypothetical protein ISCGN_014456 [Ixodes scapularis]